jgi:hypothetical protein
LIRLPGAEGDVTLELERLGQNSSKISKSVKAPPPGPLEIDVGALEAGGYSARARVGAAPPTRFDFACERGGPAWSDSRPDPDRLRKLAKASGGQSVTRANIDDLTVPDPIEVAAERSSTELFPPWVWTLGAALALGAHWYARRRQGLL